MANPTHTPTSPDPEVSSLTPAADFARALDEAMDRAGLIFLAVHGCTNLVREDAERPQCHDTTQLVREVKALHALLCELPCDFQELWEGRPHG